MGNKPKHPFFSANPHVMGIVNVTPDSFSDGGRFAHVDQAIAHAHQLIKEGAHSIDIGGESTRPGSDPVSTAEEQLRIIPVIEGLKGCAVPISVDTRHYETMVAAMQAGADVLNDISGFIDDSRKVSFLAECQCPAIVMHMINDPKRMQDNPFYNNVIDDVFEWFKGAVDIFKRARVDINMLVFDPGIGFGKNDAHNLSLLKSVKSFQDLSGHVLLGTSRKSFIGRICDNADPTDRLGGSLASVLWGYEQGVQFFRVHDVKETVQALKIYSEIKAAD